VAADDLGDVRRQPVDDGVVVFCGLDGYRAIVYVEDVLQEDVLLADRLDDEPLSVAHGAPLRLVSPQQYGYLNAKHLCAIEIHTSAPPIPLDFVLFRQHPRARVWQEERNGVLRAAIVRPISRALIRPFIWVSARGNRNLVTKDRGASDRLCK